MGYEKMTLVSIITLVCAVVILAYSLHVINHMNRRTEHFVRVAFIILCFGEFALLAGAVFGHVTAARFEVMSLNVAILLFCIFDRRRAVFTPR